MKNSEITTLIIIGTIICLCFVSFLIYLIILINNLKKENSNMQEAYTDMYKRNEINFNNWNKELKIKNQLEIRLLTSEKGFKSLFELAQIDKNTYIKHQKELKEKIESLIKELETERELNSKHLESIDTLKLKNNINNEEFYLCLLRTYKNFTKIDSSIDGRTKAFKEFILTKEAIEYLILLINNEIKENSNIVKELNLISKEQKLKTILSKERIKNTEIGNYDLIIENNKIIFKNRLK